MAEEEMMLCPRCGEQMRKRQRNCLKCGQLNYLHPGNEYMEKYRSKNDNSTGLQKTYVVGQGTMNKAKNLSIFNNSRPTEVIADKAGNLTLFALVNISLFLIGIVLFFLGTLAMDSDVIVALLNQNFAYFLIIYSIFFIEIYSLEILFMKANKPWWGVFVPLYNSYLFYGIVMSSGWFFLLCFIPVIGIVVGILAAYKLGKVYGKNSWLTLLFGPIMIPIMAFSNTLSYNGIAYVNKTNGKDPVQLLYKWNKLVLTLFFICIIGGVTSMAYDNREFIKYKFNQIKTKSFIDDVEVIVKDAKNSIAKDKYICSNGLSLAEQEEYYIQFDNAGMYFNSDKVSESALSGTYYSGYIRVISDKATMLTRYYIAVDDTIYGINETEFDLVKNLYAEKSVVAVLPNDVVICDKN